MRSIVAFILLCAATLLNSLFAQEERKQFKAIVITQPEVLVKAGDVRSNKAIWKAAKKSAFTKKQLKMMRWYGQPEVRPKHLQNHFLEEERPYFVNMRAMELLVIGSHALIMLPGPENIHMPAELRPAADLFMVVPTSSYKEAEPWERRPEPEDLMNGPTLKGLSKVRLEKPENIFGKFDLKNSELAMATLNEMLLYRDVRHVLLRSTENGWPTGMNSFAERQDLTDQLSAYKAYSLMEFDGKRILVIPACKNQKVKRVARPMADIYLIVKI